MIKTTTLLMALFLGSLLLVSGCSRQQINRSPQVSTDLTTLATLEPGWNRIEPAGNTICSDGSSYHFFVRPGKSDKLMIYLQGGGACWSGQTCDPDLKPTYKVNLDKVDPKAFNGILSFSNPANPLKDHTVVFAPYCTADVHLGNTSREYQAPGSENHPAHKVAIEHKGFLNAGAVLQWTYQHIKNPKEIFVTGSSAGAIPSPYYTMLVAEHYPQARLAQLGDGSGSYRLDAEKNTPPQAYWGTLEGLRQRPEFRDLTLDNFGLDDLTIRAAHAQARIQFAQYDAAEDSVQKFFLSIITGKPDTLLPLILKNQAAIRHQVTNFHSYIAGGQLHTILLRPEFYTYQVAGITIRDWVEHLVKGEKIQDVQCQNCNMPELISAPTIQTSP